MTRIDLPNKRQVGHLTLLRQDRKLSTQEYNALSRDERLAMIRHASGKQKYELLLNANDAEFLTQQLHPQELYLTVNELGSEYSVELLMLASTEQITALLDLDCWDGDTLSPVLSLFWLQLLLETGADKVCQFADQVDPDLMAFFLKKHLTIIRGLEAYDDDDAENAKRMEAIYDVDYATEDAAKIIGPLLRILMEQSQQNYLLFMEIIRSEMTSTFEEEVFQVRNNRLADLGFIPSVEAKSMYGFTDPEQFTTGGKSDYSLEAEEFQNPAALLAQANPDNLLAEVLTNGLSHELATELCMLVNRKMSADGTDLSATAEVGKSLQELYDILNLALEKLAGKDPSKAEEIVNNTYLLQLFQYGHSLLKQLQETAKQLLASPIGPFLDYPEQTFLDALCEKPPVLYCEAREDKPSTLQPITTEKRLQRAKLRLQQITDLQHLFCEHLSFELPVLDETNNEQGIALSTLFLTAIANRLLGREFAPEPLKKIDLLALKTQTMDTEQLTAEFRQQLYSGIDHLDLHCDSFIEFCLECWKEDFTVIDLNNFNSREFLSLLVE